jgi:hypothetical protein
LLDADKPAVQADHAFPCRNPGMMTALVELGALINLAIPINGKVSRDLVIIAPVEALCCMSAGSIM